MNYDEAMSFLEDTKQYGSRLGLTSIRALMRELGDVQEKVPVIHIGGTNGKGSVGAMLSSVFTASGYRVGWFNTPDVFSYEEEFQLNGEAIGKDRLAEIFTGVKGACASLAARGMPHPTRFEVETAAAFCWFYEEKCDVALLEVGMGGETDATNLIERPLVSVLTSIGMDHMKFLGDSLQEIASVKAGIIKPGCPVVCAVQVPEVMEVITARCEALQAPLYRADPIPVDELVYRDGAAEFFWGGQQIRLGLSSPFQAENASCVLKVLEILRSRQADRYALLSDASAAQGLRCANWPGRYERIGQTKDGALILIDGAHNEPAVRRLREALDAEFPGRKRHYIMGVLDDKDLYAMAKAMFREGDRVYAVTPAGERGLPAGILASRLRTWQIDAVPCENPRDAVSYTVKEADAGDVILAFGSLACLGMIRAAFSGGMPAPFCEGGNNHG